MKWDQNEETKRPKEEWLSLVLYAKHVGLTIEEIRQFLATHKPSSES